MLDYRNTSRVILFNDNLANNNPFPTPTAQAKAFAPYLANSGHSWGSRTVAFLINTAERRTLYASSA